MFGRRGQGLSLNTIVVSIIVVVVLVILLLLLTGQLGTTAQTLGDCQARGGTCMAQCADDMQEIRAVCENNQRCCVGI